MKKLILIRHGQAETNIPGGTTGQISKAELTELGHRQAKAVAERLAQEIKGNYTLISSNLRRAQQTTEKISKAVGLEPVYTGELGEFNKGRASSMSTAEAKLHYQPKTYPLSEWRPYPESENWKEYYKRVANYMEELQQTTENTIIVAHQGTLFNIVFWWLQLPEEYLDKIDLTFANTSITVLDTTEDNLRRIERLNDTQHNPKK